MPVMNSDLTTSHEAACKVAEKFGTEKMKSPFAKTQQSPLLNSDVADE